MTWLALVLGSAAAVGLPPRPVQAEFNARSWPAAPVIDGEIDELMPLCDGLVLSLQVYSHLELLAIDSRTVRDLYAIREAEHAFEVALLQEQVRYLNRPIPWHERPGARLSMTAAGAIVAIVAYEAATRSVR